MLCNSKFEVRIASVIHYYRILYTNTIEGQKASIMFPDYTGYYIPRVRDIYSTTILIALYNISNLYNILRYKI